MIEHLLEEEGVRFNIYWKKKVYDSTFNRRSLTKHLTEEEGLWLNIYWKKKVYEWTFNRSEGLWLNI